MVITSKWLCLKNHFVVTKRDVISSLHCLCKECPVFLLNLLNLSVNLSVKQHVYNREKMFYAVSIEKLMITKIKLIQLAPNGNGEVLLYYILSKPFSLIL